MPEREKNLVLMESEFAEFQEFCRNRGFDLSYYSGEVTGSKREIESYPFNGPRVVRLRKGLFAYRGVPYDVAEWQKNDWSHQFSRIRDEFFHRTEGCPERVSGEGVHFAG